MYCITVFHDYHHLCRRYERDQNETMLHVSHVSNYELFWEPFYVSMDSAPPFDERFIGYGYTRNSQVNGIHKFFAFASG